MRLKPLLLLLIALPTLALAQTPAPPSSPPPPAACGCAQNFARTVQLIEANYAGYRDKVTPATRPRLDSLTAAIRAQADTARASTCRLVLAKWLGFFRDGHLYVQNGQVPAAANAAADAATIRARFASAPRLPWTRASFRAYLDNPALPKKPLEGIWRGGVYEVGIVAGAAGQYQGFILKADSIWWTPGQVKFTFAAPGSAPGAAGPGTLYLRDHTPAPRQVRVVSDGVLDMQSSWYRTYPRPVAVPAAATSHSFRMLDDTTALYRIASFDGNYRLLLDSLTRANKANLRRTRLLLLDLRDNGGGSDASYSSLAPYLYTQPVREVGSQLWSTPDNNARYDRNSQFYPSLPWIVKRYFPVLRRRLDRRLGQMVWQGISKKPVQVSKLARRRQHPELTRVAVLQNRGCASTTEQFLLRARQSQKTTLFGENSAGVLDYANVHSLPLPCDQLSLTWATSRSQRLDRGEGIDNVGIAAQVRLDPAAPDMVEQVRAWYRQRR